jgi:alpha-tubulin suppressor-like RCC1 family protein
LAACSEQRPLTAPPVARPQFQISDGSHAPGNPGFFFLPPIARPQTWTGTFDDSLSPVVTICALQGGTCGATIATFTRAAPPARGADADDRCDGSDASERADLLTPDGGPDRACEDDDVRLRQDGERWQTIRVNRKAERYVVRWYTHRFHLDPAVTYRITVSVGAFPLGYADVDVVRNRRAAAAVDTSQFVPLLIGRTLPIKFRIEQGASTLVLNKVAGDSQTASTGAAVPVAPSVRLTNARGDAIAGFTVSFAVTSGGGTVTGAAPVTDAGGLATVGGWTLGPTPGTNVLTATAAGATATFSAVGQSSGLVRIAAGWWHTCGLTGSGQAYCWGYGTWGENGDGTQVSHASPVAVLGGLVFTQIAVMTNHICGLANGGHAYCWGGQLWGELGGSPNPFETTPVPAAVGFTFTQIVGGWGHTCGLDLGGHAYCWGLNGWGELGNGQFVYTAPLGPVVGGLTFTQLAAGQNHTCGLTASGQAYCWGLNGAGQLGSVTPDGNPYSFTPVPVSGGLAFAQLAIGTYSQHSCGLTSDGHAYCWGDNSSGALGDGTTNNSWAPVAVTGGLTFTALTGGDHTCGLTAGGAVYCWGNNAYGELGIGTTTNSSVPVAVTGGLTFTQIASGESHTCGVTSDGKTYCWGANDYGQLGDGTSTYHYSPFPVAALP